MAKGLLIARGVMVDSLEGMFEIAADPQGPRAWHPGL